MTKSNAQWRRDKATHRKNNQEVQETLKICYGLSQKERIDLLHQFQKTLSRLPENNLSKSDNRARGYLTQVIATLSKRLNTTEGGQAPFTE